MAGETDQFFEAWKKQVDTSLRVMDAVVESAAKMRATQLAAATETHERMQALEKALADAKSAQEMWGAQWNWALASCERSAAYWRALFEAMTEANSIMGRCLQDGMQGAVAAPSGIGIPSTGLAAMDDAYREMLKNSQKLLQFTTGAFGASAAPGSAQKGGSTKAI
jgi:hypothetical protein